MGGKLAGVGGFDVKPFIDRKIRSKMGYEWKKLYPSSGSRGGSRAGSRAGSVSEDSPEEITHSRRASPTSIGVQYVQHFGERDRQWEDDG